MPVISTCHLVMDNLRNLNERSLAHALDLMAQSPSGFSGVSPTACINLIKKWDEMLAFSPE